MNRSNWDLVLLRVLFVFLTGSISVGLRPFGLSAIPAFIAGAGVGLLGNLIEMRLGRVGLKSLVGAGGGLVLGALVGLIPVFLLRSDPQISPSTSAFIQLVVPATLAYVGFVLGLRKSDRLTLSFLGEAGSVHGDAQLPKILDTSVLIDGRIADVVEAGFLEGALVVPHFVLHELQLIADSQDSARRNRGRRGLDVVQRLQKMQGVTVELAEEDFPQKEVDLKLIELARLKGWKIATNDFNLNKVAQVQGVEVLNLNELANALKPVVLPGETMRVFILKEGKEHNQGVAYLDDGTMVVVDNARRHLSKTLDVVVTSVLQTTAGKMIFGRYDERGQHVAEPRRPHLQSAAAAAAVTPSAASAGSSS